MPKTIECPKCGGTVYFAAKVCSHCQARLAGEDPSPAPTGKPAQVTWKGLGQWVLVFTVLAVCYHIYETHTQQQHPQVGEEEPTIETQSGTALQRIAEKVASDQVDRFNMTLKGGDRIEICVQAGMVAEAFKQADDEESYLKWKRIEKRACAAAGIEK